MLPSASLVVLVAAVVAIGCGADAAADPSPERSPVAGTAKVVLAERAGKLRDFPCTRCHDKIAQFSGAGSSPHRQVTVAHFEGAATCSVCHAPSDMDHLRLVTGDQASFDEPQRLCGQCHAEKRRDWEIGAHGKHVGSWRDQRYRMACTDCHNAHQPAIPKTQALPPPPFPARGIRKEAHP